MLAARAAMPLLLAASACSAQSAPREDVDRAALAQEARLREWTSTIATGDFNGDRLRDVIWRDAGSNRVAVSLMSGTRLLAQGAPFPGPAGDGWKLINAAGDFNLDGMADLLWYNPTSNRMAIWLMRGTEPFVLGPEIEGPPGGGWTTVPATDFNGDGTADVLWNDKATNRMAVWFMHATQVLERGPEIAGPPGGGWTTIFGADADRDGMADVRWYDPRTNRTAVWLMRGTEVRATGREIEGPPGTGWTILAAGDLNRDRVADEVWFNPRTKRMTVSLMNGTELLEQGPEIPGPPGDGWTVGTASDCDGDGVWDIVWENSGPTRMAVWLMRGTVPIVRGPEIVVPL